MKSNVVLENTCNTNFEMIATKADMNTPLAKKTFAPPK